MFADEDVSPEDSPDNLNGGHRTGNSEEKGRNKFPSLKPLCSIR